MWVGIWVLPWGEPRRGSNLDLAIKTPGREKLPSTRELGCEFMSWFYLVGPSAEFKGFGFTWFYRVGGVARGGGDVASDEAKIIFGRWIYNYFGPNGAEEGGPFGLIWRGQWQAHGDKEVFRFWFDLL